MSINPTNSLHTVSIPNTGNLFYQYFNVIKILKVGFLEDAALLGLQSPRRPKRVREKGVASTEER